MRKNEFLKEAGAILPGGGYSIEIRQDEELRAYILDGETERGLNIVGAASEIPDFANDLRDPYPESGFSGQSLFLHLNQIDFPLHKWLEEKVLDSSYPVDASALEWLLDLVRKSEQEGWPHFSRMRQKMRKGEAPLVPDDVSGDFFIQAMGRTDTDIRLEDGRNIHISAARLFKGADPGNDFTMIADTIRSLLNCGPDSFPEKIHETGRELSEWILNYASTCAGELYAASEIKTALSGAHGGTPNIAVLERGPDGWKKAEIHDGNGLVKTPGENRLILFADRRDMDAEEFRDSVETAANAMNGKVFEVLIVDDEGDAVYESPAFTGDDFSEVLEDIRGFLAEKKPKDFPKIY